MTDLSDAQLAEARRLGDIALAYRIRHGQICNICGPYDPDNPAPLKAQPAPG